MAHVKDVQLVPNFLKFLLVGDDFMLEFRRMVENDLVVWRLGNEFLRRCDLLSSISSPVIITGKNEMYLFLKYENLILQRLNT